MNVLTRGVRNALRSPLRSGAIIIMLAISIGLVLAMLVAQTSVNTKIQEVKASTATGITIHPAGIEGGMGGGDPLTAEQISKIKNTSHVSSVTSTLTDQMGEDDTNLTPSFELESFGKRQMRFESEGGVAVSGPMTQSLVNSEQTNTAPSKEGGMLRIQGPATIANQLGVGAKNITSTLTPAAFAGSAGIILLIAIVGSAVPAWTISRVRPAEVLRTE
jgi:putative ABC transport system permease protein